MSVTIAKGKYRFIGEPKVNNWRVIARNIVGRFQIVRTDGDLFGPITPGSPSVRAKYNGPAGTVLASGHEFFFSSLAIAAAPNSLA
jgi:hypothetical protein